MRGLDAVDGTPVLDVKPYVPGLDSPSTAAETAETNPRTSVDGAVRRRDLESLFVDAAPHGQYCSVLAAGVLAAAYAARDLGGRTTRGLVAGVATDGCLVDAARYVLGATAGNGRLRRRAAGVPALTPSHPTEPRCESNSRGTTPVPTGAGAPGLSRGWGASDDERREAAFDLLGRPLSDVATIETDVDPPEWLPETE